jgi:hypothetical protein
MRLKGSALTRCPSLWIRRPEFHCRDNRREVGEKPGTPDFGNVRRRSRSEQ